MLLIILTLAKEPRQVAEILRMTNIKVNLHWWVLIGENVFVKNFSFLDTATIYRVAFNCCHAAWGGEASGTTVIGSLVKSLWQCKYLFGESIILVYLSLHFLSQAFATYITSWSIILYEHSELKGIKKSKKNCPSVYWWEHVSVCFSVCLFLCLSVCLSVYVSVCPK